MHESSCLVLKPFQHSTTELYCVMGNPTEVKSVPCLLHAREVRQIVVRRCESASMPPCKASLLLHYNKALNIHINVCLRLMSFTLSACARVFSGVLSVFEPPGARERVNVNAGYLRGRVMLL